jgi:hypothetical protein
VFVANKVPSGVSGFRTPLNIYASPFSERSMIQRPTWATPNKHAGVSHAQHSRQVMLSQRPTQGYIYHGMHREVTINKLGIARNESSWEFDHLSSAPRRNFLAPSKSSYSHIHEIPS